MEKVSPLSILNFSTTELWVSSHLLFSKLTSVLDGRKTPELSAEDSSHVLQALTDPLGHFTSHFFTSMPIECRGSKWFSSPYLPSLCFLSVLKERTTGNKLNEVGGWVKGTPFDLTQQRNATHSPKTKRETKPLAITRTHLSNCHSNRLTSSKGGGVWWQGKGNLFKKAGRIFFKGEDLYRTCTLCR